MRAFKAGRLEDEGYRDSRPADGKYLEEAAQSPQSLCAQCRSHLVDCQHGGLACQPIVHCAFIKPLVALLRPVSGYRKLQAI